MRAHCEMLGNTGVRITKKGVETNTLSSSSSLWLQKTSTGRSSMIWIPVFRSFQTGVRISIPRFGRAFSRQYPPINPNKSKVGLKESNLGSGDSSKGLLGIILLQTPTIVENRWLFLDFSLLRTAKYGEVTT